MLLQSYDQVTIDSPTCPLIRIWCLNEQDEPCLVRVENYHYSMYVKVPEECILGGEDILKLWLQAMKKSLSSSSRRNADYNPFEIKPEARLPFYFYQKDHKPYYKFKFNNINNMNEAAKKIREGFKIKNGMKISTEVLENDIHRINPCLKLFVDIDIPPGEWIDIDDKSEIFCEDDKISIAKHEFLIDYAKIKKADDSKIRIAHPLTMSYDIETYSTKRNAFPNANRDGDVCYMISCTFEKLGLIETRRKVCLYIGRDLELENVKSVECDTEKELLEQFFGLIREESPILFIGYNTGNFDNEYISNRCYRCNVNPVIPSLLKKNDYNRFVIRSNTSKDCMLFSMSGRISIDILMYMHRVYPNLLKHSLEFVSNHFLGEGKNDMPYSEMFRIYREYRTFMLKSYKDIDTNVIIKSEKDLLSNDQEISNNILSEYKEVILYAVQDTVLPLKLMEKLNIWTAQIELCKLMYVSLETLLTQGEQVRSYSQLYNMQHKAGFVLNVPKFPKMSSNGGLVTEPLGGLNYNEIALDFASLYPSIMRSHNISYDTLIKEEDITSGKISINDVDKHEFTQEECIPPIGEEMPNKNTKKWKEYLKIVNYTMYVIKKEVREGQLPILMGSLKEERTALRKEIKKYKNEIDKLPVHPKGHPDYNPEANQKASEFELYTFIYDARQLSMKVSMNAVYGTLKVNYGAKISFPHLAQLITAKGREHIRCCNDYLSHKLCDLLAPMESEIPKSLEKYKLCDKNTYNKDPHPTFEEIKDRDIRTMKRTEFANSISNSIENKTGIIVYNDTDSVYCRFPWLESKDAKDFGGLLSKSFSGKIFGDHLLLEFEQVLYVAIHLAKKMYTSIVMDIDTGNPAINNINGKWITYTRGLCNVKRDGAKLQRDILTDMSYDIMCGNDMFNTLSIIFSYILSLLSGKLDYTELSYMVKMGEDYALDGFPMAVFKEELIARGKQVHTGEKIDFCSCLLEQQIDNLFVDNMRRKIPLGKTYYLNEEIKANQAPTIDYVLYLDKIGSRLDDFFENVYGQNEILNKIVMQRARSSSVKNLCRPFEFFASYAYEAEEYLCRQFILEENIDKKLSKKDIFNISQSKLKNMSKEDKYKSYSDIILPNIYLFIENKMDEIMR